MTSQLAALEVLSCYIKENRGAIPTNPNQLVSYSCHRCDLLTLDYYQADGIIKRYQNNVDRLRESSRQTPRSRRTLRLGQHSLKSPSSRRLAFTSKAISLSPKLSVPRYSQTVSPKYSDIDGNESDVDTLHLTVSNGNNSSGKRSSLMQRYISYHEAPPQTTRDLIQFSRHQLSESTAQHMLSLYRKHGLSHHVVDLVGPIPDELDEFELKLNSMSSIQQRPCCGKRGRSDCVIGLLWFCLMTATLFGLSFGLIHIGNGVMALESTRAVSVESCQVLSWAQTECADGFEYRYAVRAEAKCPNQTLYGTQEDTACGGAQLFDIGMNVSCFVGDCTKREYSFIGFDHVEAEAEREIEIGSVTLLATIVPFCSFVAYIYFFYPCGGHGSNGGSK